MHKPRRRIPSGDSKYVPPIKARREHDEPVKAGGSQAIDSSVSPASDGGGTPGAKGVMGWGERSGKAKGVMGQDQT